MTRHDLKLNDRYFDAVTNAVKTFEVRKDDRGFRVGDTLVLHRVNDQGEYITAYSTPSLTASKSDIVEVIVTYILTSSDFSPIPKDYVIMGIKLKGVH